MEYGTLAPSIAAGLKVSAVGLGCNNFGRRCDANQTRAVVHKALDLGITFFDIADTYGGSGRAEEYIGKALGRRRADIVLATKFGMKMGEGPLAGGASPRYIRSAVEASLKRLGTDTIDLYQLHTPDPETRIEETLETLDALVREGKVRHIGCSNLDGAQIEAALSASRGRGLAAFVTAQNRYSVLERGIEADVVPVCERNGIGILPYYPLAQGLLTGKFRRGHPPPENTRLGEAKPQSAGVLTNANFDVVEKLESFARERGRTLLELAVSWLVSRRYVSSVIAGARTPEQLEETANAAAWKLAPEELDKIDRLTAVS
jgi:aryl-alcohol dehydrogenase-like predicted oxidoreductase